MKQRAFSILLAILLFCGTVLPPSIFAQAATLKASTWLSPYDGGWENSEKNLMNGWHYQEDSRKMIFTYYEGTGDPVQAVYCIAPSNTRRTGAELSEFDENYITSYPWNQTISGEKVRELLSCILYYGYCGQIATTDSRQGYLTMDAATLKAFDEALATQLLVWEVVVGERNSDFSKHSSGSSDAVFSIVKENMPGYESYFLPKYHSIVSSVSKMLKVPSFLSENASEAGRIKLEWNGSCYRAVLTDSNDALDGWSFSGSGLAFSVSGNQLIITASSLPDENDIVITASRQINGRSMVIQTNSSEYSIEALQPTAVPGSPVSSEKKAFLKVYGEPNGTLKISKASALTAMTEGNTSYSLAGCTIGVFEDEACTVPAKDINGAEAKIAVQENGQCDTVLTLYAGDYWVKELSAPSGSGYQLNTQTRPVSVTPSQESTVCIDNTPLNDPAGLIIRKTDENGNVVPGADLSGAQYEVSFYAGQYTAGTLPAVPDARWIIETKKVGSYFYAQLSDSYLVSGDGAKYGKDEAGAYYLPLGTVTIREIKAPAGFTIEGSTFELVGGNGSDAADGTVLIRIVDRNSAVMVLSGNQTADSSEGFEILQKEKSIPVTANVKKVNSSGAPIQGVVFNLKYTDTDGVVRDHRATSDAIGNVQWTGITYGIEGTLYEVSAPTGYKVDPVAAVGITKTLTGTLDSSGEFYVYNFDNITNDDDGGKVTVKKSSNGPTLEGFTFKITGTSTLGATVNKTATTGSNGIADFGFIPTGTYTVSEINTPAYMTVTPASQSVTVESTDVQVSFTNTLKTGTVNVTKSIPAGSNASLEGFTFRLSGTSDAGTTVNMTATTDSSGKATFSDVPYGTYDIKEELTTEQAKIWKGKEKEQVTVSATAETVPYTLENEPLTGTVNVTKSIPAGSNASLEGFTFRLSGTSDIGTSINMTATTDSSGKASFTDVPYGTYDIKEELTEAQALIWKGKEKEQVTVSATAETVPYTLENEPLTGTVNVTKTLPEGATVSLEGFTFRLSGTSDIGTTINMTATTGPEGTATFSNVPYGTYDIKEELTEAQAKIWKNKDKEQVTVSNTVQTVSYTLANENLTGSVTVTKAIPAGSTASLEGFTFRLSGTSDIGTTVNMTATTDSEGKATFSNVPYGTYDIKEELTEAQARIWKGKDKEQVTVSADQDAATYTLTNEEITIPVKVLKTSDSGVVEGFTFTLTGTRAIGGTFTATATTDSEGKADFGEVPYGRYTVTEAPDPNYLNNGPWTFTLDANTESPYTINAHNSRVKIETLAEDSETHIGVSEADDAVVINDTVHYYNLVPGTTYKLVGTVMDAETKEPFKDASGSVVTVTKEYEAEAREGSFVMTFEIDATGFAGKKLVIFEELYLDNDLLAEHKDFADDSQTVYLPDVTTDAKDDNTQINHSEAGTQVSITDTVTYTNLRPGKEYVVKGILMDKATGNPLTVGGNEITAEQTFTPESDNGTIELTFTFDASALGGTTVVVFETVYLGSIEVAVHADIDDADQTVYIPEIGTTATSDDTDDHVGKASGSMTITDVVVYKGLEIGREYVVKGILMDKATGDPLLIDGKEVTAEKTLTAAAAEGTVELTFTFDGSALAGTTVVAFETLYTGNKEVAVHADLSDENQTVYIPEISTSAKDKTTGTDHAEAGTVTIVDTVTYKGLKPGKEYKLQGVLMNKATNEPIKVNGEKVTAEVNFTPEAADGTIDLSFTFDASALVGTTVVVFESVYLSDIEVAVHADITDENQTVYIPEIGTTATAKDTGSHVTAADEEVVIVDVVTYKGLKVGKEYTVKGVLMDKATNKALLVDGKEVTAETTFTADKADGSVTLTFTFNGVGLDGSTVVAFETLNTEGKEVAVHADLGDEDQSVQFPGIRTTIKDKVTGIDHTEAGKSVTVIDTVHYAGLIPDKEYTVKGSLVNKATGKELGITAEKAFTPEKSSGDVDVEFTFDASLLAGTTVVAFETLYSDGIEVAVHADLSDEEQTEYIPDITTDAKDKETGTDHAEAAEEVTIVDTVTYKGLKVGQEYTVKGILMDKSTVKALLVDGKEVTAEKTFTAEKADGTIELEFTFDGTLIAGKTVVVFETLYTEEKEVAIHADIEDDDQTVYIPEILTTAVIKDGDKIGEAGEEITVVDRVDYKGLKVGEEYTVEGILMVVKTGEPLKVDDKEVTASLTFTADKADGYVELEFTFDASALAGQTIVVYEKLEKEGKEVASHEDLKDLDQTIYFPLVSTDAKDEASETSTVTISETATVIDVVSYRGLEPGKEYVVKGVLMVKETGKALIIDEKEITAEATFTPEKSEGEIEMTFTFNAVLLRGKTLVIFERLYQDDREIAAHTDLSDPAQTLVIPPDTPDTGEDNTILWSSLLLVISAAGIVLLLIRRKRN